MPRLAAWRLELALLAVAAVAPLHTSAQVITLAEDDTAQTGSREVIRERYPDRTVKIRREVTQDSEGNYVNDGPWQMWDKQGNLIAEGNFKMHRRDGLWTRFYNQNDAPLFTTSPYSLFTAPFESQADFQDGQLHGSWSIRDSQGRIVSEWEFVDGKREGKCIWFFPTGEPMQEVHYKQGELHGETRKFNRNGEIVQRSQYEDGRRQGSKIDYYDNKEKKSEGQYLHARVITKQPDNWWEARPATFSSEGSDEKHGVWMAWYPNGQKQMEGRYDHNVPVGSFNWWYSNGQKAIAGGYAEGKQDGRWVWWHPNGQKSAQGEYNHGNPTSRWSRWSEDGRVAGKADFTGESVPSVADQSLTETPHEASLAPQVPAGRLPELR